MANILSAQLGSGPFDEILAAAVKIRRDVGRYAEGVRRSFLQTFYYQTNEDTVAKVLTDQRNAVVHR